MFGSIVIQKEVEKDHWASRGAGATYWSEVMHPLWMSEVQSDPLERGMTPALYQSDLSQRGSVPALGPTSRRQLSRTGATKTERGGYIARQIHEVRRKPERRPGARWRTRCEAGATHWSGVTNPRARSIFGRFFMFCWTFSDLFLRPTRFLGVL